MNSYILKIIGVVFISILVDIVIPSGKMEKYIKSVVALIITFVIIAPLPNVIKNINNYNFETNESIIDYNFIKKTNYKKIDNVEEIICSELKSIGISNLEIELISDASSSNIVYMFANVDKKNMVLNSDAQSININEKIYEVIMKYIEVKKENIVIYE